MINKKSKLKTKFSDKSKMIKAQYRVKSKLSKYNILKFFIKFSIVTLIWFVNIFGLMSLYYLKDLPNLEDLNHLKKQRIITILDSNGEVLNNYGDLYSKYVKYDEIPKILVKAVVATEDRRFFNHFGVDLIGTIRAAYQNYKLGHVVQGGSTITQQLAKIAFLSPSKTIKRKFQEFFLALYLEHKFSKKQIMSMYLNRVYLGAGIYGIDAGAKYYFNKKLSDVNLYEAAIITGLLKAPSKFSPLVNIELSGQRAYQVILNMQDAGYITKQELDEAKYQKVALRTNALGKLRNDLYFSDYVLDWAESIVDDGNSNIIVKTTMNKKMQKIADNVIENNLGQNQQKMNVSQAALVSLAKDGAILCMVGGKNYKESPFNRAVKAKRQVGSAFKIFVYLSAFEYGNYSFGSIVDDSPVFVGKWSPRNFSRKFLGQITLKEAFANSVNTVAVRLSESIGRNKVIKMAYLLGITEKISLNPSIALGVSDLSLLEITNSFAIINNNGYKLSPYAINEIITTEGKILYKKHKKTPSRVLSQKTIDNIKELLHAVISSGTGKLAYYPGKKLYAKTGTTQEHKDACFIGFNDDITTGVWVGNDDNKPMNGVVGGTLPATIWRDFMSKVTSRAID